ncbi:MAG: lamin tail domain-containing protein, partial [Dinghuibacter sp.]|nr:lamin tail domain-containing protein [Dinghuibacter sp.]
MNKTLLPFLRLMAVAFFLCIAGASKAQVIISQYYEGTGTNKWIELTNLGSSAVNTASPQLKLGLWSVTGSTGNIAFSGAATQTVNLTVTIPAGGTVLIGNTGNGTEIPYLTAASAAQTSNTVINFNGNDGIALLNA